MFSRSYTITQRANNILENQIRIFFGYQAWMLSTTQSSGQRPNK